MHSWDFYKYNSIEHAFEEKANIYFQSQNDGKFLDLSETNKLVHDLFKHANLAPITDDEIKKRFEEFDTNKNNLLEPKEFLKFFKFILTPIFKKQIEFITNILIDPIKLSEFTKQILDKLDANHTGLVIAKEIGNAIQDIQSQLGIEVPIKKDLIAIGEQVCDQHTHTLNYYEFHEIIAFILEEIKNNLGELLEGTHRFDRDYHHDVEKLKKKFIAKRNCWRLRFAYTGIMFSFFTIAFLFFKKYKNKFIKNSN